jgi:hypothetical protein
LQDSVERERDFTYLKYSAVQGPYQALTKHFREQHGFKTAGKERNDEVLFGKNGCKQKINLCA